MTVDELRDQLAAHGAARRRALQAAQRELDQAVELAPEAIAAGLSKVEISALAAISRPTLDAKLAKP